MNNRTTMHNSGFLERYIIHNTTRDGLLTVIKFNARMLNWRVVELVFKSNRYIGCSCSWSLKFVLLMNGVVSTRNEQGGETWFALSFTALCSPNSLLRR